MVNKIQGSYDSTGMEDKAILVNEIKKLFMILLMRHASEDDDEKQWVLNNCKNPILLKKLSDMTIIMLHIVDAVGRLEPVNSITISKDTNIPKGTVSKVIPKLISKEFIVKESLPNNKKEYLFHLTPLGKELFHLHQMMHKQTESKINEVLRSYDIPELQFIVRLLDDFGDISWSKDVSE